MQVRTLVIVLLTLIARVSLAQSSDLIIEGTSPDLYILHTVTPKENWYSLARLYNGNPKEIAGYNSITIDKPLTIGQQVKVPLRITNFTQNGKKAADEVLVPVYHVMQDKEWLYRVSVNYNKVPVETLEKWNGVTNDEVKVGMKLIVGYLRVKKDQSAFASAALSSTAAVVPKTSPPVVKEEKKAEPVKQENKETTVAVVPQEKKQPDPQKKPEEQKPVVTDNHTVSNHPNSEGGYFRIMFDDSGKAASGTAGIFKSTSGWQDAKYYALMNNVPVGTIVRVYNPANSKSVYAKVLGELPDMKESIGLTVRISDAAASELGMQEGKFNVAVRY